MFRQKYRRRCHSDLLFVYGTLRSHFRHSQRVLPQRNVVLLGMAWFQGRLYDLGSYPGATVSRCSNEYITGELYRIQRPYPVLHTLDQYENGIPSEPPEYRRNIAPVRTDSGQTRLAWIYLYIGNTRGLHWIRTGDYVQYCLKRPYRRNMHK